MNSLNPRTLRELTQYVMRKFPDVSVGTQGWREMQKIHDLLVLAERAAGKALLASYIEDNP